MSSAIWRLRLGTVRRADWAEAPDGGRVPEEPTGVHQGDVEPDAGDAELREVRERMPDHRCDPGVLMLDWESDDYCVRWGGVDGVDVEQDQMATLVRRDALSVGVECSIRGAYVMGHGASPGYDSPHDRA